MTFNKLISQSHLLKVLEEQKLTTPTEVQQKAIPHVLEAVDVMACAQTGTGKTAAFTLPILQKIMDEPKKGKKGQPRALILTPTREIADQIFQTIRKFIARTQVKAGLVLGGASYGPQIQMLGRPLDILVATPGRLMDHMRENRIDLSAIETIVLDEADRMLDMGFVGPVEDIIAEMPKERQILFFSATFDKKIADLARRFLQNPVEIKLATATSSHSTIEQSVFFSKGKEHKIELLEDILADETMHQAIIFMRTKHSTEKLAKVISGWGYKVSALHGDMRQRARERVIEKMHKGNLDIIVATDVAARGIDVKKLSHVVNFDLPQVAEDYTHRVGRTGRAGASGVAVSLVSRDEMNLLYAIEKMLGKELTAENERPAKRAGDSAGRKKPSRGRKPGGGGRFGDKRSGNRDNRGGGGERERKPRREGEGGESRDSRDGERKKTGYGTKNRADSSRDEKPRKKRDSRYGERNRSDNFSGEITQREDKPRRKKPSNGGKKFGDNKFGNKKPKGKSFGKKPFADGAKPKSKKRT